MGERETNSKRLFGRDLSKSLAASYEHCTDALEAMFSDPRENEWNDLAMEFVCEEVLPLDAMGLCYVHSLIWQAAWPSDSLAGAHSSGENVRRLICSMSRGRLVTTMLPIENPPSGLRADFCGYAFPVHGLARSQDRRRSEPPAPSRSSTRRTNKSKPPVVLFDSEDELSEEEEPVEEADHWSLLVYYPSFDSGETKPVLVHYDSLGVREKHSEQTVRAKRSRAMSQTAQRLRPSSRREQKQEDQFKRAFCERSDLSRGLKGHNHEEAERCVERLCSIGFFDSGTMRPKKDELEILTAHPWIEQSLDELSCGLHTCTAALSVALHFAAGDRSPLLGSDIDFRSLERDLADRSLARLRQLRRYNNSPSGPPSSARDEEESWEDSDGDDGGGAVAQRTRPDTLLARFSDPYHSLTRNISADYGSQSIKVFRSGSGGRATSIDCIAVVRGGEGAMASIHVTSYRNGPLTDRMREFEDDIRDEAKQYGLRVDSWTEHDLSPLPQLASESWAYRLYEYAQRSAAFGRFLPDRDQARELVARHPRSHARTYLEHRIATRADGDSGWLRKFVLSLEKSPSRPSATKRHPKIIVDVTPNVATLRADGQRSAGAFPRKIELDFDMLWSAWREERVSIEENFSPSSGKCPFQSWFHYLPPREIEDGTTVAIPMRLSGVEISRIDAFCERYYRISHAQAPSSQTAGASQEERRLSVDAEWLVGMIAYAAYSTHPR